MIFQMWSWRVSDVSIQTPISWSHWTAQQPRTAEILCKVPRGHPTVCSRSGVCRLGEAKSMTIGIPWWMGFEKWWTRVRDVAVDVEVDCLKWVSASFLTLVACLPYFEDANISYQFTRSPATPKHVFPLVEGLSITEMPKSTLPAVLVSPMMRLGEVSQIQGNKKGCVTCFWWTTSRTAVLLALNWNTTWFCLPCPSYPIQESHIDLRWLEMSNLVMSYPKTEQDMRVCQILP